jgi:hypothetical protein
MRIPYFIFMIISPAMLLSCRSGNHGIMCTEEYRMLTISIKDSASNPVILSEYFVKKTSTGEILDFKQEDPFMDSINRMNGTYIILTDSRMGMTSKTGAEFEFHGLAGDVKIVQERYIIGNDGCHVRLLSGNNQVIVSSGH